LVEFLDPEVLNEAISLSGQTLGDHKVRISKVNYSISKPPIKVKLQTKYKSYRMTQRKN
jgi:hypothetical protein